jgi:S1-C subfamily serine protease
MLSRVVSSSPAARAGLRVGDRVYEIGGQDFTNADEFLERIKSLASPQEWLIERNGRLETVHLELP